ncbi:MAG: hypothetical protein K8I00_02405, partial [Candidatus Omnitrophica bacterium]|nr:hypothetical protein [Candidatus Omnitrophota bacterium]
MPAHVTGTATWLEVLSSGTPFTHDNLDMTLANVKERQIRSTVVRALALERPEATWDELQQEVDAMVPDMISGTKTGERKYANLEARTQQARQLTANMMKFNAVDDIVLAMAKQGPISTRETGISYDFSGMIEQMPPTFANRMDRQIDSDVQISLTDRSSTQKLEDIVMNVVMSVSQSGQRPQMTLTRSDLGAAQLTFKVPEATKAMTATDFATERQLAQELGGSLQIVSQPIAGQTNTFENQIQITLPGYARAQQVADRTSSRGGQVVINSAVFKTDEARQMAMARISQPRSDTAVIAQTIKAPQLDIMSTISQKEEGFVSRETFLVKSVKKAVNPENRPITAMFTDANADIITPLLAANPKTLYMTSPVGFGSEITSTQDTKDIETRIALSLKQSGRVGEQIAIDGQVQGVVNETRGLIRASLEFAGAQNIRINPVGT